MTCQEMESFVHPFVDGELVGDDRALVERHVDGCQKCRDLVSFHSTFKANLRARLKRRVDPPAELQQSITRALARAETGNGGGVRGLKRAIPYTMIAAAAATLLVVFGARMQAKAGSPIVEESVRAYEKDLPLEVGGTAAQVGA